MENTKFSLTHNRIQGRFRGRGHRRATHDDPRRIGRIEAELKMDWLVLDLDTHRNRVLDFRVKVDCDRSTKRYR